MAINPAFAQAPPDLPVTRLAQSAGSEQRPAAEPIARPSTRAELDGPRNISLTIVQPTPVQSILQLLFRGTPFSTVVHSSARGMFTGELRNLTLRQALEAVLFSAGLDYDVRGTVIRIFPRRPSTRLFRVDLLSVRRSWQSRPSATGGALVTSIESDAMGQLSEGVATLLSSEGRHFVDRRAGIVHVTDFTDRLDQIGVYLEAVQVRANRQIRIEVQVLRVGTTGGSAAPSFLPWPAATSDARQFIRGLEAAGSVETIASSRLLTMNNEPAALSVMSGDGGERSIAVTPQASADGFVQLHVAPRFVERPPADSGRQAPPFVAESDSILRVREGETAIISGLPYVGDARQRTEILILLTPFLTGPSLSPQAGQR